MTSTDTPVPTSSTTTVAGGSPVRVNIKALLATLEEKLIAECTDIETLEATLQPVLIPIPTSDENPNDTARGDASDIAQLIEECIDKIKANSRQIQYLTSRLDLPNAIPF